MDGNQRRQANTESVPAHIRDLSEDAVKLLEEHARLFKVEMKEELSAYLRDGLILGLGGLVGAVGFALLSSRLPRGAGPSSLSKNDQQPHYQYYMYGAAQKGL